MMSEMPSNDRFHGVLKHGSGIFVVSDGLLSGKDILAQLDILIDALVHRHAHTSEHESNDTKSA